MGFFVLCFYQGKEARRRSGFRKENVEFHWGTCRTCRCPAGCEVLKFRGKMKAGDTDWSCYRLQVAFPEKSK